MRVGASSGDAIYIYIHTTSGFGLRKNTKIAGVYNFLVYMQTASKYCSLYIHHHGSAKRPHVGEYRKCCCFGILHIHKEIVYTSHFLIFSWPRPGGDVYIYIYM